LAQQATQEDRSYADAFAKLGLAEQRLGHRTEAIRAYRRYLRLAHNGQYAATVYRQLAELEGDSAQAVAP
jgi:hypothetical protein